MAASALAFSSFRLCENRSIQVFLLHFSVLVRKEQGEASSDNNRRQKKK